MSRRPPCSAVLLAALVNDLVGLTQRIVLVLDDYDSVAAGVVHEFMATLIDALVQHEGLGMVIGYADAMTAVVLGKGGQRNLHTGDVIGKDPVAPYARAEGHGVGLLEKRIWQLQRVMDFPNAGDLWLISTVYADGTVAALEELVGNHGGLGGEQSDAFVFHPADMDVPETRNATDVFHILNNHRGKAVAPKPVHTEDQIADWAPGDLAKGIGQFGKWIGYSLRAMTLQSAAYADIVSDPLLTGPALLIAVVTVILSTLVRTGELDGLQLLAAVGMWFLAVALVFAAGWLLTRRGAFTQTLRALGLRKASISCPSLRSTGQLTQSCRPRFLSWASLPCGWAPPRRTKRRAGTLVLPIVVVLIYVVGSAIVALLLAGAEFTLQSVMMEFGVQP